MRQALFFATTVVFFVVVGASAIQADEPKPITIPLNQVWAWRMPGTRKIQEIDTVVRPLVESIRKSALQPQNPQETESKPGFAVIGKGSEALREAHKVLVERKAARQQFSTDDEISIVFHANQFGMYVYLKSVERLAENIVITYQFVPHSEAISMESMALIPLGKLTAGKYKVDVVQAPLAREFTDMGHKPISDKVVRRIVCKPFEFTVVAQ